MWRHACLSYGGNETLLVNMHISAKTKDDTRSETQACPKCLIVQQPVPNRHRLEMTEIFSQSCHLHRRSIPH